MLLFLDFLFPPHSLYAVKLYSHQNIHLMTTIDRKQIIEDERKKIFIKPIVTANPTFNLKEIEDFYTLFNLYADNRRQADVREIVTTAKTLGYDKSHEYIFKSICDIAEQLEGEWIGFEQFLEMLTHAIVLVLSYAGPWAE